jgi:SHO1 osmosensor
MNGVMDSKGRRTGAARGMSMDNILGDPFALATISIAVVCYVYFFFWLTIIDTTLNSLHG